MAELIPSFEHVIPGSNWVNVGIYNSTQEKVVLQKGMILMPPYFDVPGYESEYEPKGDILQYVLKQSHVACDPPQPSEERLNKLFSKLDLNGTKDWDEFNQQKVGELIKKFHHIFALEDTEFGCTDIVEHEIKLNDPKPFKD